MSINTSSDSVKNTKLTKENTETESVSRVGVLYGAGMNSLRDH